VITFCDSLERELLKLVIVYFKHKILIFNFGIFFKWTMLLVVFNDLLRKTRKLVVKHARNRKS